MSNTNIDSLQINITAATSTAVTNIKTLVKQLGDLQSALASASDAKAFTNNLNALTGGFMQLGKAVDGLNVDSVKAMSNSVANLAKNLGALSGVQKSISNVGVSAANLERIEQLQDKIFGLNQTIESGEEVLRNYRNTLSRLNVEIPTQTMQEWGDDKYSNRATIGVRNTHAGSHDTKAVAEAFGWEDIGNETDLYTRLAEELRRLTSGIASDKAEVASLQEELNKLNNTSVDSFVQSSQNLVTVGETAGKSLSAMANGLMAFQGVSISQEQAAGISAIGNAAAKINTVNGTNVYDNLYFVGEGMKSLSNIPPVNAENMELTAKAINRFGYESSGKAGANITATAEGLKLLVPAIEQTQGINSESLITLAGAIGKFGSAGSGRAVEYLPQLATSMRSLMTTMASAPEVSDKTLRLAEAMAQFSQRATTAANVSNRVGAGFNIIGTSAHRSHLRVRSLAAIFGSLYANFFLLIRGARLAGKAIDYSSQMTEAMNVVDVAFGKMNGKMKDFMQTSIKDFGLGRLAAAQYASRFQAMAKTMGINAEDVGKANDFILEKTKGNSLAYKNLGNSVADMSINLTKLTADMASLYNQDYDDVAADMQAVMTGMTRPLRKYGLDLTVATLKEWALKNGLDADIDSMTQAQKTLLRYQYVMSNASVAMGDFQKTADTWANAMRTVKQLLQEFARILGEAFINAFKPAILAFRNFMYNMLDLTQSALNAVGKLLGWTKIDFGGAALVEDTEAYADALDDAAGAAKKLKGQLRGIDELNNLTTNNNGGGSGSGDSGIGYNGADLWENIKETQEKYLSDVTDWKDLGRRIANHFQEGLESVDWQEVYANAIGFGTNAAEFLNGLIKPEAFNSFGKTLAGGVMTAIKTAFAFGKDFDWENLGNSIAEGVNGFFDEFDGGELADTLDVWVQGIWRTMKTAIKKIDWKDVFADLLDFLSHIDIETMEIAAGAITFLVGANVVRTALTSAIVTALGESPLALPAIAVTLAGGLLIGNGIGQIVSWIAGDYDAYSQYAEMNPFSADTDFGDATYDFYDKYINALSENYWTKTLGKKWGEELGKAIETALIDAFDFWKDPWKAITGESWNEYWSHNGIKTEDLLKILPDIEGNGSFTLGFLNIGKYIVQGILQGATDESGNLSFKALFDNIVKGIKKIFGIESPAKKMYSIGENIALGIIEGIKNIPFLAKLNEWFDENVKPWFSEEKWKSLGDNVKNKLSSTLSYSNLYNVGYNMGKGLSDAFGKMCDNIWTDFIALKNKIANNPIIQTIKTVTSGGSSVQQVVSESVSALESLVQKAEEIATKVDPNPTPTAAKSWHGVPYSANNNSIVNAGYSADEKD